MLKKAVSIVLAISFVFVIGCAVHVHQVGNGPQENQKLIQRQWYFLWGLVPMNTVDTHAMAGDALDYEIRTEMNVVDSIISIVTSALIYPRTVTVTK